MTEHRRPGETPRHAIVDDTVLSEPEKAKSLIAGASLAALGTLLPTTAAPFVSHVVPVLEEAGSVLFLFSGLAEHTKALLVDPRASLLFVDAWIEGGDPSALARVTLVGRCIPVPDDERAPCTEHYVRERPHAAHVATFADFRPYRFEVQAEAGVRWIGGFGRAAWIDPAAYAVARVDRVAAARSSAMSHAGAARATLLVAVAARLHALDSVVPDSDTVQSTRILAVDGRGIDLLVTRPQPRALRLAFPRPIEDPSELPAALAALG